jgi:hypothetical protein
MKTPNSAAPRPNPHSPAPSSSHGRRRWLLFVHQVPPSPSNLRVRTWRRLQQMGAIAIKQAVYVLPDTPSTREDFEWLKAEVKGAGGDATVFAADGVDTWSDDELVEEFRRARQQGYAALAAEIEQVLNRIDKARTRGGRSPAVRRLVEGFRERFAKLEQIDFFGSAGRDRATSFISDLEARIRNGPPAAGPSSKGGALDGRQFVGRLWATRPRPGVDRMSSAWLIRRFIDPRARFAFAPDRDSLPAPDAVAFDMFGVDFSHRGDGCTFETLCADFAIAEPAVARIAAIVHDLDLKESRYGAAEAPTVDTIIVGLQLATADDDELLERGITLFESLYRTFARSARVAGPRPLVKPDARTAAARRRPARRRRP